MKRLKFVIFVSIAALFSIAFIAYATATSRGNSPAVDAKALFDSKCSKCHGKDGRASGFKAKHVIHARDFTAADWQNDVSDERIFNSISNGKGKMPSFKKNLSDDQIDALVAYVRRFRK